MSGRTFMRKRIWPAAFVLLWLVGSLGRAVAIESQFQWSVHENAEQTWGLSYAEPESDVGLLWIWCAPTTGEITIASGLVTSAIKDGERGAIILSTPTKKLRIEGKANFNEASDAIEISALLPHPQELAVVFGIRGPLRIGVPGNQTTIPLNRKAQSAFAEFSRRCPSLRSVR